MISPLSGKAGFMRTSANVDVPIYIWSTTINKLREMYRTSNSLNYPRRTQGLTEETFTISGVDVATPFDSIFFLSDTAVNFKLGWLDLPLGKRHLIDVQAMVQEIRYEINYISGPTPSHIWTVTLMGVINPKAFSKENISATAFNDSILCHEKKCNKLITTTDTALNGGQVRHVTRATIRRIKERSTYATSNSNNRLVNKPGVKDELLDFDIQGDFDYWFNKVTFGNLGNTFKIFYGSAPTDYWDVPNQKLLGIDNLVVDIQSGRMIQATVHLGASYGN